MKGVRGMSDANRKYFLIKHFSKKIIEMFSDGVPEEMNEKKKEISYEEAKAVLEHTILELGNNAHFILKQ